MGLPRQTPFGPLDHGLCATRKLVAHPTPNGSGSGSRVPGRLAAFMQNPPREYGWIRAGRRPVANRPAPKFELGRSDEFRRHAPAGHPHGLGVRLAFSRNGILGGGGPVGSSSSAARPIDFTSPKASAVASADEDHRPYRILKPPVSVGPQALGPHTDAEACVPPGALSHQLLRAQQMIFRI